MHRALPLSRPFVESRPAFPIARTARGLGAAAALLAASTSASAQGACFTPGTFAPTGNIPVAIATADLNADGRVDLVTANQLAGSVSVLLNLGGATFAPQVAYTVGSEPISIAVADFDADGDLDLAVANFTSQTISILLNQGAGTFVAGTPRTTNGNVQHVASADLNGDGRPDLVSADYSTAQVSVFLGLGAGAFGPEALYAVGVRPFWSATADLDGDGDVDVAVANSQGRSVSILLNQGAGTFAPQTSIPLADELASIAAGDLDGDGAVDLVVGGADYIAASHTLAVLINNGNAVFAPPVVYATATGPHAVQCADLNGDGNLDVVDASYGNSVVVRLNPGTGALGPQTQFTGGGGVFCVGVGDLDGDGRLDLAAPVLTQSRVLPLLNCGPGPGIPYCSGDGTGTPCPCGNNGIDGNGCSSSVFKGGAALAGVGTASIAADTLVLKLTDSPQSNVLFFQGTARQLGGAGSAFGDGKLCAGGATTRLGIKTASGGTAQYPSGSDPLISIRGAVTMPGVRTYQCWYRNAANFCTSATFNLTNGYEITWTF